MNPRGGGLECLRRIMFCCSGLFCQGLRRSKGFRSGCWLPLGSAMGAEVRVSTMALILQRNGRWWSKTGGSKLFDTFPFLKCRACLCKAGRNRDSNEVGLQSELTGPGGGGGMTPGRTGANIGPHVAPGLPRHENR